MKIVITGGHHTSALPVIKELRNRGEGDELFWIGHKHSIKGDKNTTLEFREITSLGIVFYDLKAGKLYRTFNLVRLIKVPFGVLQAFYYLVKLKPDVILSFGGYIAAPVVLAGWFLGIPSITHEQTVVAGYANRFISNFAKKILLTWGESKKYFKEKPTKVVGLPLRSDLFESNLNNFRVNTDLPTIYITAGKTGSHKLNEFVLSALEELLEVSNVIHQCGDTSIYDDYSKLKSKAATINAKGIYNLSKFIFGEEIGEAFSKADLVIGRSGAHTIYELLALEKPAILIPIPWVSHNEQFENAKILEKAGLARIIEEKDVEPTSLVETVTSTLEDLQHMKINNPEIKKSIISNAGKLIADEVLATVKEKNK